MLSPSEYDHLCDQLIKLYDDLDNAVINDMVRRMMRMGKATDAIVWQAKQLQESGLLYEDILSEIAKRTDATQTQVRTLFEDAGIECIRNDNQYYRAAGLEGIMKMSDAALQTLNAGYIKCQGELQNLTLTTANTAQAAYISACDLAYMEVSSGTMDYGTAIRRAVESAADEGSWVLYPSGHKDRLDVAVRRSTLTGVGQTVRQLSVINANDMDCDLMEITAHSGARPSHADWQGQLVSLSGKNAGRRIDGARVYTLKEIGYGTGDGFGGWNCRHDWFPFFEGISSRTYTDKRLQELNAKDIEYNGKMYTEYEIDQMQRSLERDIRPDSTRTWVNGFGRSTAQKAVHATKNHYKGLTSNNKNDKIKSSNKGGVKQKLASLKSKLQNAVTPEKHKIVSKEYLDSLPKLSKLETLEQALKSTNPTGRDDNCQRCVPTYEMRRRGYNVIAGFPPQNYLDDDIGLYDYKNIFKDAKWIRCKGNGLEDITEYLKKADSGTRVEISIDSSRGLHLFAAENINGSIKFIDPQTGSDSVEWYFNEVYMDTTEFARIDNLEITNLIKECLEVLK